MLAGLGKTIHPPQLPAPTHPFACHSSDSKRQNENEHVGPRRQLDVPVWMPPRQAADAVQPRDAAESVAEDVPPGSVRSLYADLLGADNLELAEAAGWEGLD